MSRRAQSLPIPMNYEKAPTARNRCVSCVCGSWKVFTCIFSHVTLVTLVVSYCLLGAYTFEKLESENEIVIKQGIKVLRRNITGEIWSLTTHAIYLKEENWTKDVIVQLQKFENKLVAAIKQDGWDGNEDAAKLQWTFTGSLFYSIIVITTIGYGHIAPRTKMGKISTIFYAILGIPLMLLCLSNIGDIMASSFRFIYWRICCFACTREPKKPRNQRRNTATRNSVRYPSTRSAPTSSLKRSIRNSQRSADSGIDPYYDHSMHHAHSDPELRYDFLAENSQFEDFSPRYGRPRGRRDMNASMHDRNRNRPQPDRHTIERERHYPRPTSLRLPDEFDAAADFSPQRNVSVKNRDRRRDVGSPKDIINRLSKNSKYSDISPAGRSTSVPRSPAVRAHSLDRKSRAVPQEIHIDKEEMRKTPVLCNKYAFEIIDDPKSKRFPSSRAQSLPRHPQARQQHYRQNFLEPPESSPYSQDSDVDDDIEMQHPARHHRNRRKERLDPQPTTRIMSPMGMMVPRQARHMAQLRDNDSYDEDWDSVKDLPPKSRPVPIWLCVCLVVGYILGGAYLFKQWEPWSFLESAYFCFITLTTIGFGDFVPNQTKTNPEVNIAICSLYLLFGIALLAMSFNLVQEEVIANVKSVARRLGIIKDEEDDD